MSDAGDTRMYLSRFNRREQFRWFHRTAPLLVTQAYAAVYVIKSWDEFFDVTGMVRFSLGLLIVVLCMHLAIMEGLLYVKRYAAHSIQIRDSAAVQSESGYPAPEKYNMRVNVLKPHSPHYECTSDLEYSTGYKTPSVNRDLTNTDIYSRVDLPTELSQYQRTSSSSSSEWTEDSESSSYQSSSSVSSSSSSSYCNLHEPNPATISRSSSSSYCDIGTPSGSPLQTPLPPYTMTSLNMTSLKPTHIDGDVRNGNIPVKVDTGDIQVKVATHNNNHQKPITSEESKEFMSSLVTLPAMGEMMARLKSLQDVYIVVDVFKALLCLDVLRQLLVYYSIFYWRLSLVHTVPVFVIPAITIVGEVSLTVVCFLS